MSEDWHSPIVGVDGLTCYQRWLKHDARYKEECKNGLCVSDEPIDCAGCKRGSPD